MVDKKVENTPVKLVPRNLYQKMAIVRNELQEANIKKSGKNKFTGNVYYELGDFIPTINKLNSKYGLFTRFLLKDKIAVLLITNVDNSEDKTSFEIPVKDSGVKGATEIQNLGAQITYLRRYLLMIAYEIAEGDVVDAQSEVKEELSLSDDDILKINSCTSLEALNVAGKDLMELRGEKYRNMILKVYSDKKAELNQKEVA